MITCKYKYRIRYCSKEWFFAWCISPLDLYVLRLHFTTSLSVSYKWRCGQLELYIDNRYPFYTRKRRLFDCLFISLYSTKPWDVKGYFIFKLPYIFFSISNPHWLFVWFRATDSKRKNNQFEFKVNGIEKRTVDIFLSFISFCLSVIECHLTSFLRCILL